MNKIFILATILAVCLAAPAALTGNVNTVMLNSDVTFKYSIVNDMINIQVMVNSPGAIGIGLGGSVMAGIDVAHLWWDGSKVNLADRNYINSTPGVVDLDTARGGTSDFTDQGSTYDQATGNWVASISRKLTTGDKYDNAVTDGAQMQVAVARFGTQTWGAQHTAAFYSTVKLSSSMVSSTSSAQLLNLAAIIFMTLFCLI
ncbi:DOMON domain protein (macronuclear) [Tetrahymena thermophila SB210]|uniref:DOMON domain protein n=1 Tax=Tetrahymena thermophila (strain SB210) TaxID=312017 RepID=I7MAC5_TETTS|nr:DOMON domain protein [Tetrahymena thermophila SB210]EAS04321.1 DOMON domain protein [Tetrahymena thermophila SB210]|eukprot:XP_001024566.1 DOMON domain protein [Tetrahymena thermophila SB210]